MDFDFLIAKLVVCSLLFSGVTENLSATAGQ